MKRLGDRDAQRSWGPQSTAIPVGGTFAWILGAGALLWAVAYEVPEVKMWATIALPASLVISVLYVVARRLREKPPTTLRLDGSSEVRESALPDQEASNSRHTLHNSLARCLRRSSRFALILELRSHESLRSC